MSKKIAHISSDEEVELQIQSARFIVKEILEFYWNEVTNGVSRIHPLSNFIEYIAPLECNQYRKEILKLSSSISEVSMLEASFRIGEIYTQKLPKKLRSQHGVYFTPPALTTRLLDNIEKTGFDWGNSKIVDPACGGGAFLAPIALRMKHALKKRGLSDEETLNHIAFNLRGKELDPFSAWMSQVFLEISLYDELASTEIEMPVIIDIGDTLSSSSDESYDLVVGNPPYSKVKLDKEMRQRYSRSLYGHANLYGLFTDKALSMLNASGILAYVTPTSFLSGLYFKALRHLLSLETKPVSIDFIESRKGVFADVLQETVLAVFSKQNMFTASGVSSTVRVLSKSHIEVEVNGSFKINSDSEGPWLIPRSQGHSKLLSDALNNHAMLSDYGYKVSTGPLVWNRHKDQIVSRKTKSTLPLLWGRVCI